jgi:hypothetical protein
MRTLALAAVSLLVAGAAFADAPEKGAAASTNAAAEERPVRVRATHRVDVIAPGERVETVLDRMRSTAPVPAPEPRPGERLPLREMQKSRAPARATSDHGREGGHGQPSPGGAQQQGQPPPGGPPQQGPPGSGPGPQPERPRR